MVYYLNVHVHVYTFHDHCKTLVRYAVINLLMQTSKDILEQDTGWKEAFREILVSANKKIYHERDLYMYNFKSM